MDFIEWSTISSWFRTKEAGLVFVIKVNKFKHKGDKDEYTCFESLVFEKTLVSKKKKRQPKYCDQNTCCQQEPRILSYLMSLGFVSRAEDDVTVLASKIEELVG
jgi:hypothetical protein